jgi:hypothetical protein
MFAHEDYFLTDVRDRNKLFELRKRAGTIGFTLFLVYFLAVSIVCLITTLLQVQDVMFFAITLPIIVALFIAAYLGVVIYCEIKRSQIIKANEQQLTDSRLDNIRRKLFNEWKGYNKLSNGVFITFVAAGMICGIVLGILGTDFSQPDAAKALFAIFGLVTILFCVLAFIPYFLSYLLYNKRVKPLEFEVIKILMAQKEKDTPSSDIFDL